MRAAVPSFDCFVLWFRMSEVIRPLLPPHLVLVSVLVVSPQEAESLIAKKIHPQTVIAGWREATKAARQALLNSAVDHGLVTRTLLR